jgi:hypothetical protein
MQKRAIKIEFALLDEVRSQQAAAFKLYDVQSELIKAQMQVKKAKNEYSVALGKAEEGLKKANELGAESMSVPFKDAVSNIKGAIGMCDRLIAAIDKSISAV